MYYNNHTIWRIQTVCLKTTNLSVMGDISEILLHFIKKWRISSVWRINSGPLTISSHFLILRTRGGASLKVSTEKLVSDLFEWSWIIRTLAIWWLSKRQILFIWLAFLATSFTVVDETTVSWKYFRCLFLTVPIWTWSKLPSIFHCWCEHHLNLR